MGIVLYGLVALFWWGVILGFIALLIWSVITVAVDRSFLPQDPNLPSAPFGDTAAGHTTMGPHR
jgi:hypothetical protein